MYRIRMSHPAHLPVPDFLRDQQEDGTDRVLEFAHPDDLPEIYRRYSLDYYTRNGWVFEVVSQDLVLPDLEEPDPWQTLSV